MVVVALGLIVHQFLVNLCGVDVVSSSCVLELVELPLLPFCREWRMALLARGN